MTEAWKAYLIGTAIALGGGIVKILNSIRKKENKSVSDHVLTIVIVIVVGFSASYFMHKANLHNEWYSSGILFCLGYGYDKFLKFLDEKLPNYLDTIVEDKLNVKINKDEENPQEND